MSLRWVRSPLPPKITNTAGSPIFVPCIRYFPPHLLLLGQFPRLRLKATAETFDNSKTRWPALRGQGRSLENTEESNRTNRKKPRANFLTAKDSYFCALCAS